MDDHARIVAVTTPLTSSRSGASEHVADVARPVVGFRVLHLAGWTAFAVAMVGSRIGVFPLDYMIIAKGSYAVVGALVALLLRTLYRRLWARDLPITQLIVIGVVASYVAALLWTAVANAAAFAWIDPIFRADARRVPITVRSLTNGSLYNAFIMLAWSLLYFGIKWQHALNAERERVLRAETLAQAARLEALRYQLNPHFLFNALNGVSALVLEQRTQPAAEMISRLAAFLRLTLEGGRADLVPLDDELILLRAYLAVEQPRFEERLRVSFDIAPHARRAQVPTLLLQPLVENAVRHAVSVRVGGATIGVNATVEAGRLRITVTDDADEATTASVDGSPARSFGIGLANTRERLAELYGDAASLDLVQTPGRGARVTIQLPFRPVDDRN